MEVANIIAAIIDNGMFFGLAQQLARSFKKVYYHYPSWQRGFPTCRDGSIGDGFPEVILADDLWRIKNDVGVFICPDIQHSGIQAELESQGKLVWGSRSGDSLELFRGKFMKIVHDVGLDVAPYEEVVGLKNLTALLTREDNKYIKISRWRGDMETWRHFNIELSRQKLLHLARRFGPLADQVHFLVFDPIETNIEVGYDGYCIDGWFPNVAIHGIEKKNEAYIGAIQPYDELPEQVREVNERMSEVLGKHNYRNFFSSEIRIKDDKFYFIDPTCRAGIPSGDGQFLLYKNLPEIILAGAAGDVIEPEYTKKFVVQLLISHDDDHADWRDIQVPDDVMPYVRLFAPVKCGGVYSISPSCDSENTIGSVLGEGDTIDEAIEHAKNNSAKLENNPISIKTDAITDVLKEMHAAREHGIEMTEEEIPEPASLLDS